MVYVMEHVVDDDDGDDVGDGGDDGDDDDDSDTRFIHNNPITSTQHEHKTHHECNELPGLYLPGLLATWFSFTRFAGYLVCMRMAISLFIVSKCRAAAISAQDTSIGNP